jgi:hypothetical protein
MLFVTLSNWSRGAASGHAVIPGAWLAAQAKTIPISLSPNGPKIIDFRHLVDDRERAQDQPVNAHPVQARDI